MNKQIKAIILDMGGVVLQTKDLTLRNEALTQIGKTYEEVSQVLFESQSAHQAALGEIRENEHWAYVGQALKLSDAELKLLREKFWAGDCQDEDLLAFIRSVKPEYQIGLLSNAWSDIRSMSEARFTYLKDFDVSIYSAEVGLAKPDPRIYQLILRQMDVKPEEAVFMDDLHENIEGAKRSGLHAIHFDSTENVLPKLKALLGML